LIPLFFAADMIDCGQVYLCPQKILLDLQRDVPTLSSMDNIAPLPLLIFLFVVGSLAAFRATELWVIDRGPFRIFERIRDRSCGVPVLCEILTCYFCMSAWSSLLYTAWLWMFMALPVWLFPVWWFSVWGGAVLIYRVIPARKDES